MPKHLGSQLIRTGYRSPWQNGIAERWIGSWRRELLDQVIILNERHLRRLIRGYIRYYHEDRIHDSLDKDAPERRAIESCGVTECEAVAIPPLGGLHHRYTWQKAA
jgi:putative transposase